MKDPVVQATNMRKLHYHKKYDISVEYYNMLMDIQGGLCAVCGADRNNANSKLYFDVDHDHRTGTTRGLLCNRCNNLVGLYEHGQLTEVHTLYMCAEDYVKGYLEFAKGWPYKTFE